MKRPTPDEVEREVVALEQLDLPALRVKWRQLYRTEPPLKVRSGFLRRAVAYRIQELAFGGLKPTTRRRLKQIAQQVREQRAKDNHPIKYAAASTVIDIGHPRRVLSMGSQLMREWNGVTMVVDVVAGGFGWRGKTYKTLSAVALAITGTKWSGPRFFGLNT